ncbi:diguanylate cyclase (GGDEF)-like protein/PAS domain S-box-containing protein [Silvibacterium bohemicum]|uniref:Diguanylate cyclase (GGDEF)-like protein/PAS domain S-box-containing protein n=1 Tax=Silvibacterium bohemicum TaxID=1577686 RepID=A0A841JS18_9BACT|nr:GGDEF domain-containing protein [Silvibacterium bohemicum]MBB6144182.1 diguanylate cyclase (GGDEF)-like protein/PAS domain S-box-containing protein [Silvibacterium bohemicum]
MPQSQIDIAMKVIDRVDTMLGYWDRNLRCRFVNAAYPAWFGRTREEILKMTKKELLGPFFELEWPYISGVLSGQPQVFERDFTLPDGSIRHTIASYYPDIANGIVQGFSVQVTDVTPLKRLEIELQAAKKQAEMLATHDFLTGLPNRVLLMDRISAAMMRAEREGGVVGLVAIDIDEFKNVNDSYGHEAGDFVLKSIANRMKEAIRATDTVTRLGGDEFLLLAADAEGVPGIESAIARVQRAVNQPLEYNGIALTPSISCGAAIFPSNGKNPNELLVSADAALYQAKRQGKSCLVLAVQSREPEIS